MPENQPGSPKPLESAKKPQPKPWPLSWVIIAILAYVLFQIAWIVFKG